MIFTSKEPTRQYVGNDDLRVTAQFFSSTRNNLPMEFAPRMTWGVFRKLLEEESHEAKTQKADGILFAPTIFNGTGTRAALNAGECGMLVIDSDGGLPISEVLKILREDGIESVLYTSASNRADERFRIITPLAQLMDASTQKKAVKAFADYIASRVGMTIGNDEGQWDVDRGKLNPYSLFYVPGQYECAGSNQYHHIPGEAFTAEQWVEAFPQAEPRYEQFEPRPYIHNNDDDADTFRAKVEKAVSVLDPGMPEDPWVKVGMGLEDALGSDGLDIWDKWSSGSRKYKSGEPRRKWKGFGRGGGITIRTVFKWAYETDPKRADEFRPKKKYPEGAYLSLSELIADYEAAPPTQAAIEAVQAAQDDWLRETFPEEFPTFPSPVPSEETIDPMSRFMAANGFLGEGEEPEVDEETRRLIPNAEDDRDRPPPKWLIEGMIQENTDCAIYAPSEHLKSFVAIDLAYSIATGVAALGSFRVNDTGCVFYFCGEGYDDVIKRRRVAWEIGHGFDPYEIRKVRFIDGIPSTRAEADKYIKAMRNHLAGRRAKLIVIDTLNRALNGQPQDRAETASKYFDLTKYIRGSVGGAILTIGHMGKDADRGERGSSAFPAGFDTIFRIPQRQKDSSGIYTLNLLVKKQKATASGQEYILKSHIVNTPDGASLILRRIAEADPQAFRRNRNSEAKEEPRRVNGHDMLSALETLLPNVGTVGTGELIKAIAGATGLTEDAVRGQISRGDQFTRFQEPREGKTKLKWGLPTMY